MSAVMTPPIGTHAAKAGPQRGDLFVKHPAAEQQTVSEHYGLGRTAADGNARVHVGE